MGDKVQAENKLGIKPYISDDYKLVIPPGCDPKYKYWDGGQSLTETLQELVATQLIIDKHFKNGEFLW